MQGGKWRRTGSRRARKGVSNTGPLQRPITPGTIAFTDDFGGLEEFHLPLQLLDKIISDSATTCPVFDKDVK
ncbi:hypothetical protein J4Q44_G00220250 [Coregonus suidteri]|uniref:Uncharacterized protein n=1 Tax=Coregonus suidteri TaxID=861788 RepID=A0AAN8QZ07_9TELE